VLKVTENREYWLRGSLTGVAPLLQPVAHALLQARAEVNALLVGFPDALLWEKPGGVASPGFHLQHLAGVLDRLLTYARDQALTGHQLHDLAGEGAPQPGQATVPELLNRFNIQIDKALDQISQTREPELLLPRPVGRARIPSTVLGLLFHAAEHTQRHTGQLLVTIRVLMADNLRQPL
jgi:hypothetical protein